MLERAPSEVQSEVSQQAALYESADRLVMQGKRFSTEYGTTLTVKSFFCDEKDIRGWSNITLVRDITEGENSPVDVKVTRELPNGTALIRELTLSGQGVDSLMVKRRHNHKDHDSFIKLYSGEFDRSKISLDAVQRWLEEARVNKEAGTEEPVQNCQSPRRPLFSREFFNRLHIGIYSKK